MHNSLVKGFPAVYYFTDRTHAILFQVVSLNELAEIVEKTRGEVWDVFFKSSEDHAWVCEYPNKIIRMHNGPPKERDFSKWGSAIVFFPKEFARELCEPIKKELLASISLPAVF